MFGPVLLAVCILLTAAGCGQTVPSVSEPVSGSDAESLAQELSEAEELPGTLPGVYRGENDSELDAYVIGGLLLLEQTLYEGGELIGYYAQEIWPDDIMELTGGDASSVNGQSTDFSDTNVMNYYLGEPEHVTVTATDRELRILHDENDQSASYQRTNGNSYHADADEQLTLLRGEHAEAEPDPALAGSWTMSGEICAIFLQVEEDGSFLYAAKIKGTPIFVMIGACAAEADGTLYFRGERIGCGQTAFSYTMEYLLEDGGLYLTNAGDEPLMPYDETVPFSPAVDDWHFPEVLNEELWNDEMIYYADDKLDSCVTSRLLESSDFVDEMDQPVYYYFDVPEILISSEDAQAVNTEIEERFLSLAEEGLEQADQNIAPMYPYITWYGEIWEDVLSVIICAQTDWESAEYGVYCFDMDTGARLDNQDILDRLNITEEGFLDVTRSAAESMFRSMFDSVPEEDRAGMGYDERLAWTVSDENINMDLLIFPDSAGDLTVIAPIGSLAGADWYYRYLYPFYGAVG